MCPFLFVLEPLGANGDDFICMKPISPAERLKMNLDEKHCLIFMPFHVYDNPDFTGFPLLEGVLMNMKAKCFTVHGHEITDLKHL